jgi:glycosyltransferase involved in cell wall biosynthesis
MLPLKILFITGGLKNNSLHGGALVASRLSRALRGEGVEVSILNGVHGTQVLEKGFYQDGVALWNLSVAVNTGNNDSNLEISKAIQTVLNECQPELVHILQYESWRSVLLHALQEHPIPIVATALDYGWFCPKTTLIKEDGSLCDGHGSNAKCWPCLTGGRDPIVRAGRWIGRQLPVSFSNTPVLGALVKDAEMNRNRLNLTLNAWPHFLKSVSRWIAPSQAMLRLLTEQAVPPETITHIPYGFDAPKSQPAKQTGQNIVFGYAGRGIYEKGFHLLAEAFPLVARQFPDVRLRLFGISQNESHRYARQSLQKLRPVWSQVDFDAYDGTNPAQIAEAHSKISAMIIPSIWYDNLPLTVIESLAHGTPVVASHHSSASDPVQDNVNGFLFDAFKAGDLAEKMSLFASDAILRSRLSQAASYKRTFANEASDVVQIYEQALAAHT